MCELIQTLTCFVCVTPCHGSVTHQNMAATNTDSAHKVRVEEKRKKHTRQWPLLNLVPLSVAQTANECAQSRPFKFIWTDVIKLTHGVG